MLDKAKSPFTTSCDLQLLWEWREGARGGKEPFPAGASLFPHKLAQTWALKSCSLCGDRHICGCPESPSPQLLGHVYLYVWPSLEAAILSSPEAAILCWVRGGQWGGEAWPQKAHWGVSCRRWKANLLLLWSPSFLLNLVFSFVVLRASLGDANVQQVGGHQPRPPLPLLPSSSPITSLGAICTQAEGSLGREAKTVSGQCVHRNR